MDLLSGLKAVPGKGGARCVMVLRDDFTRYSRVYYMLSKSGPVTAFKHVLKDTRTDGSPEVVRSDGGGEFCEDKVERVCVDLRIKQEFTTAKTKICSRACAWRHTSGISCGAYSDPSYST